MTRVGHIFQDVVSSVETADHEDVLQSYVNLLFSDMSSKNVDNYTYGAYIKLGL